MKKFLLILCACLFGALGGVKAWTSVTPYDGRTYYLYNMWGNSYWYGTNADYNHTASIGDATRVTVESGHKLAFTFNNTTYRIYHSKGTKEPGNTNGVNFTFEGSATGEYGYQLMSKNNDKYERYMNDVGQFQREKYSNRDWQFISVYEVNANTPNICATEAESSYLSEANGWERVIDNATLEASLSDYFFAIVCANYPGLMVNMADGNSSQQAQGYAGCKSMWYSNSANPEADNSFLWMIEKCNESGYEGYTFRNTSYPSLTIQAEYDASHYAHTHDQPNPCRWSSYALTPTDGVYTIKTLANGGENYLGLWTPSNDYINGQELRGDRGVAEQGKFLIYRKLVKNANLTSYIKNPAFDSNKDGWTATGGFQNNQINNNQQGDFTGNFWENWNPSAKANRMYQELTNLPNGFYKVKIAAFVNTLAENNSTQYVFANNDKTYLDTTDPKYYEVRTEVTDNTLSIGLEQTTATANWMGIDNVSLTYLGAPATAEDYTRLQNAIDNAEGKTPGFDDGEFAPYNNVAVLKALAAAKAIDMNADNLKTDVQDATAAIADGNWTANSGEVNAIPGNKTFAEGSYTYNGTYDLANGWSNSGYNTRIQGIHEGTNNTGIQDNDGHVIRHAMLVKYYTSYGGEGIGYTLPLKANTMYEFSFEYGLWNEGGEITKGLTVTTPNGGTIEMTPSTVSKNEGDANKCGNVLNTAWYAYSAVFMTTDAGDYILNIVNTDADNQRQMAFSNFELKKYNGKIEEEGEQVYYGVITENTDLTPTAECPIVDITGATFTDGFSVDFNENPNGLIIATSAQKIDLDYLKDEPVKNVISSAYNVCERLVITDGHPFVAPFDFEATRATYSRTIGAGSNFGTICVPFALESDEKIQYYTTKEIEGGVLKLTEVSSVDAGIPAIFKKKNEGATSITASIIATAVVKDVQEGGAGVKLVGTFERITIGTVGATGSGDANGKYYINSSNQFCEGKDWFYVGAFRAYLEAASISQSRLNLLIDDEATDINELKTLDEKQGLADGKYLIGGKIIVVKEGKKYSVNGMVK